MLKATVLPSWIRQRMRERKEVVRTALKGTFWLYLTYEMDVLGLIRWECRIRAYSGDPVICWCSAIPRECPDFSGSGSEGGDVRCSDQQGQNKS